MGGKWDRLSSNPTPPGISQTADACILPADKISNSGTAQTRRWEARTTHPADVYAPPINIPRRVNHLSFAIDSITRLHIVPARPHHFRALHLHPPQPLAIIQNKIIALAVSPRTRHAKSQR